MEWADKREQEFYSSNAEVARMFDTEWFGIGVIPGLKQHDSMAALGGGGQLQHGSRAQKEEVGAKCAIPPGGESENCRRYPTGIDLVPISTLSEKILHHPGHLRTGRSS